jgi:hypothetical protein
MKIALFIAFGLRGPLIRKEAVVAIFRRLSDQAVTAFIIKIGKLFLVLAFRGK